MINASENIKIKDFEDSIRCEEAKLCGAEYIITSNVKNYKNADIAACTPEDFLDMYLK